MISFVGIANISLKVYLASILAGVQDIPNGWELIRNTTTAENGRIKAMISREQAIEALKTLKTYCDQYLRENGVIADYKRSCDECPLDDWCWYDREHLTPDDWQIPQERTEE